MHLGISGYFHDSSVALIGDKAELLDFKKEEYLSRIKGDKSFPRLALTEIIENNDLNSENLKSITFYEKPLRAWLTVLKHSIKNNSLRNELTQNYFKNIWKSSITFQYDLQKHTNLSSIPIYYSDHYLSHTLSGLFYRPNDSYAAIVADGYGDHLCSAIHHVKSHKDIELVWKSRYPHSLGLFYSAITDYLGFKINEGEYKVMGLAAYGEPIFYDELERTLSFEENRLSIDDSFYDFVRSTKYSYSEKLTKILPVSPREPYKHLDIDSKDFKNYADIACSAQKLTEDILIKIFKHAHELTKEKHFIFTGGVAMNSVAVQKLSDCTFIEKLVVPPSPGDSGAAIGAAFYGLIQSGNELTLNNRDIHSMLYPGTLDQEEDFLELAMEKIAGPDNSIKMTADLIAKDKVIATAYGDIETGPRALGHRSMLCNAHSEETVSFLNTTIKSRSKFRPTAPVVLDTHVNDYFDISENIADCYAHMGAVTVPKENISSSIKGVIHIDGTARVQVCNHNQLLGKILSKLENYNIFVIANTSFNISSDPMVYSKEDAYMSIERMKIDYLLTEKGLYKRIAK